VGYNHRFLVSRLASEASAHIFASPLLGFFFRTGFLERWLMPQACQCLRGIWTMLLKTCFDIWAALKWSGSWTGGSL